MFYSLKQRIIVMITLVTLGLFAVMAGLTYFAQQRDESDAKREMKEKVEIAYHLVEYYASLSNSGVMSEADAKSRARDALSAMRFGKEGYFFVTTKQGYVVLMPPRRDLENTTQWTFKDEDDFAFFQEVTKIAIPGGYISYRGVRFGGQFPDELYPKLSYVAQHQQWGWIIGSGIYRDEIVANTHFLMTRLGYVFGLVWLLFVTGMMVIIYPVPGFIRDMMMVVTRVRMGDINCDVPHTERRDEMGDFARAVKAIKGQCSTQNCDLKDREARRQLIEKARLMKNTPPE